MAPRSKCCRARSGESAWLYDGATTINVGLTGAEHTRSDGYKRSEAYQMNEAGQVRGHSDQRVTLVNNGPFRKRPAAWPPRKFLFQNSTIGRFLTHIYSRP